MSGKDKFKKPWGFFVTLHKEDGFIVKKIVVKPQHRLSLQRHLYRNEHWHVINGKGELQLEEKRIHIETGTSVDIPQNAWHRISNSGSIDLIFIEIQRGSSLTEEDIERKEDDYGRAD
tara:strand:- start:1028 stop:1381 length:354 start_codon:yes stop_codon:yes gene_type:complete